MRVLVGTQPQNHLRELPLSFECGVTCQVGYHQYSLRGREWLNRSKFDQDPSVLQKNIVALMQIKQYGYHLTAFDPVASTPIHTPLFTSIVPTF